MKLLITQCHSAIGRARKQRDTIAALGLRKLHHQVIHKDSPQIRGMVAKVSHLVKVQEID